ncbi:hypothetical protein FACS1894179_10470 [Bacteroidia bacterium]|nr:hypothetical protein FACS1894169_15940 [Bacteroidia bacterium]GHV41922.1 hypothetical protein FACS1894179_10470 [Bacteroidia bacterium]
MSTLTIGKYLTKALRIEFINQSVPYYDIKKIYTSPIQVENQINIHTESNDELRAILGVIDDKKIVADIDNSNDTYIVLE